MGYEYTGQLLTNTEINPIYNNAIQRCYNENVHALKPWYIGCTMSPLWYDPAYTGKRQAENPPMHNCYEWIRNNYYTIDGEDSSVALDKDIKIKGNMVYGPDTCLFVPSKVNNLFRDLRNPICKDGDKYIVQMFHKIVEVDSLEKAITVWQRRQGYLEGSRDQFLKDYDGKIPENAYDAIAAYDFSVDLETIHELHAI